MGPGAIREQIYNCKLCEINFRVQDAFILRLPSSQIDKNWILLPHKGSPFVKTRKDAKFIFNF